MYVNNLDERFAMYDAYWKKENKRPLIAITSPKKDLKKIEVPFQGTTLKDRWWDTEYVIKNARARMENTYYAGESLPTLFPDLGPDIFAAFLGCEIQYEESTSFATNYIDGWEGKHYAFDETNVYWKKIVEMTNAMLADANGDYLVGVTDLHGGMDALVSLRGPEDVCMDVYDEPEEVQRVLTEIQDAFKIVLDKSYALFEGKQKGYTNWMGIYKEDPWFVASSDFIYMISPDTFEEFSSASIRKEAKMIGNNIFHLDGIGSLRHIDRLLEMDEIQGIQWVYGAGQPSAKHWIEVLKKIQDAGKLVEITCEMDDMKDLFESGLKPEGVRYLVHAQSEDQADHVIKMADDIFRKPSILV